MPLSKCKRSELVKTSPRNTLLMSAVLLLFLFSFQFALADKDVKSQWVKHVISTGFKGAPFMNIADLNSDGRMDVLATVGRGLRPKNCTSIN